MHVDSISSKRISCIDIWETHHGHPKSIVAVRQISNESGQRHRKDEGEPEP